MGRTISRREFIGLATAVVGTALSAGCVNLDTRKPAVLFASTSYFIDSERNQSNPAEPYSFTLLNCELGNDLEGRIELGYWNDTEENSPGTFRLNYPEEFQQVKGKTLMVPTGRFYVCIDSSFYGLDDKLFRIIKDVNRGTYRTNYESIKECSGDGPRIVDLDGYAKIWCHPLFNNLPEKDNKLILEIWREGMTFPDLKAEYLVKKIESK